MFLVGHEWRRNHFPTRIVLDNSVISALHEAESLSRVLGFWPGTMDSSAYRPEMRPAAWKLRGAKVVAILDSLGLRSRSSSWHRLNRLNRGSPYLSALQRTLGQGESAVNRNRVSPRKLWVATDDRRARRACDELSPRVRWVSTERLLGLAVTDGFLTQTQAEEVWAATKIRDPKRRIP